MSAGLGFPTGVQPDISALSEVFGGARACGGDLLAAPISAGDRTSTYAQVARTPARHHRIIFPGRCPSWGQSAAGCAADWPPSGEWSGHAERCASRD